MASNEVGDDGVDMKHSNGRTVGSKESPGDSVSSQTTKVGPMVFYQKKRTNDGKLASGYG